MQSADSVAIVTVADDLHALIIQHALRSASIACEIVECNTLAESGRSLWSSTTSQAVFKTRDGTVDLSQIDLLWWRRFNFPQKYSRSFTPIESDLIDSDCRATLLGAALTRFHGVWVSHPHATVAAENKLLQMAVAQSIGFRVPRTLISQDPTAIRRFCEELQHRVVVKPVKGTQKCHIFTRTITSEHLADDESLRVSPAVFQELVPGDSHLRIHCFGKSIYPILIRSDSLDWRENLEHLPFEATTLDPITESNIFKLMIALSLKMGVIDIKLTKDGEPVWLEINPQGQFLFSQALSGFDLTAAFVSFLRDEISAGVGAVKV